MAVDQSAGGVHRRQAPGRARTPARGQFAYSLRVRDRLTFNAMLAAVRRRWPAAEPIRYDPAWWDGATNTPSLIVSTGRVRRRAVILGNDGLAIVPASQRRARRTLRRLRHRPDNRVLAEQLAWYARPAVDGLVGWDPAAVTLTDAPISPRQSAYDAELARAGQLALFDAASDYGPLPQPNLWSDPGQVRIGSDPNATDYVVCRYPDCGGLRPVEPNPLGDPDLPCPRCGRL